MTGGLGAGVCHGGERHGRHCRLAGAHVSQEQPIHGRRRRHVGQYLVGGLALLGRELKRQGREEGRDVRPTNDVLVGRHVRQARWPSLARSAA